MLRRLALIEINISEYRIASIIRLTGIGGLGAALAVTSDRSTKVVTSSLILLTLMMEALPSPRRWFLQESQSATSQKTAFFRNNHFYW
jgi:hypothetical protein